MRTPTKIGIIGLAGSGKDTLASIIRSEALARGSAFVPEVVRFAEPLKRAALHAFGEDFDDRTLKEREWLVDVPGEDRILEACHALSVELGFSDQEFERFQDAVLEQAWVEGTWLSPRRFQQVLGTECVRAARDTAFVDRVKALHQDLLIPDVRFANELTACTHLIYVHRPEVPAVSDHPSEQLARYTSRYVESVIDTTFGQRPHHVVVGDSASNFKVARVAYNTGSLADLNQWVQENLKYLG